MASFTTGVLYGYFWCTLDGTPKTSIKVTPTQFLSTILILVSPVTKFGLDFLQWNRIIFLLIKINFPRWTIFHSLILKIWRLIDPSVHLILWCVDIGSLSANSNSFSEISFLEKTRIFYTLLPSPFCSLIFTYNHRNWPVYQPWIH